MQYEWMQMEYFKDVFYFGFFFLFPQLTCFKIMKKLLKVHFFPLRVT